MRGYLQTFTGRLIEMGGRLPGGSIHAFDIAHALAHQCRFVGHSLWFYSNGQHSLLVSKEAERMADAAKATAGLWGLLHDAAHAYIGDLPGPLRETELGRKWREQESMVLMAVADEFGLPLEAPAAVRAADKVALATERRDLLAPGPSLHWGTLPPPLPHRIEPLTPQATFDAWCFRFYQLQAAREREDAAAGGGV